jgi:hypothetical protein
MATLLVAPKPFYEIQGEMADSQIKQQDVEINQLKIQQARQQMADDASVKALQQQAYNTSQGQPQDQQQAQQPDITQQAKQPVQQQLPQQQLPQGVTSPTGQTMPSFMGGPQQEAAGKQPATPPGVNTPQGFTQEPEPDQSKGQEPHIMQQLKNSQKELDSVDQQIKINDQAIQLAYKSNNPGAAQRLLEQNKQLKADKTDAAVKQMTLAQKSMEIFGQLANGYKGSYNQWLKDNPNATPQEKQKASDKFWAETITSAQTKGIPAEGLFNFHTPDQRNQYATGIIDAGEKVSDQVKLTIADLKAKNQLQIANDRLQRDLSKDAVDRQFKAWKQNDGNVKTGAAIIENQRKILESEIKAEKQAALFGDEKAQAKVEAAESKLKLLEREEEDLGKKVGGKEALSSAKADQIKTDSGTSTGATNLFKGIKQEDAVAQAKEYVNRNPGKKAEVEKMLKEAYPDADFKLDETSSATKQDETPKESSKDEIKAKIKQLKKQLQLKKSPATRQSEWKSDVTNKGKGYYEILSPAELNRRSVAKEKKDTQALTDEIARLEEELKSK